MKIERNSAKPLRWTTIVGLVLVPVLVAGGLLWANWNSDDRVHQVQAAIVNLDEPVTIEGQYVPLGRQLTAALVDSDRVQNLGWVLASAEGASEGLASGKYAATVTIPKEFSAAATSYAGEASAASSATIQVQTSPVAGIADATLGRVIAREAAEVLNQTLTSGYLDQIYIGFNEMGSQFVTIADGAGELADGATQLADGITQASDGATQLSDGMWQFSDGMNTMSSQVSSLPGGARALAQGVDKLSDGADQLADGLRPLAKGMRTMKKETAALPSGSRQLADGAEQLAGGVKQYVGGVNQLVDQTISGLETQQELVAWIQQVSGDQAALDNAIDGLKEGIAQLEQLEDYAALSPSEIEAQFPELACPAEVAAVAGCDAYYQAIAAGFDAAVQGLNAAKADDELGPLLNQLDELPALLDGIQLPEGGVDPLASLTQLRDGGQQLVDGAEQLADGTDQFADGMPALASGIAQAADGATQLSGGLDDFAVGLNKASSGLNQFAAGMKPLADGVAESAEGAAQLAQGTDDLATGLVDAADGASQLADGAQQLADGLEEGKSQLPNYSDSDRANLADVVSEPVSIGNLGGISAVGMGWATMLLMLALWLGALATYVVLKALSPRLLGSARSSGYLVAEALLPGVIVVGVQAVVLATIGQVALALPIGTFLGVLALILVGAVTFAVLNHALVAWLGGAGRLVSIAFAVLGATSAVTGAAPEVFGVLRAFSPITPALDAVRAVILGSDGVATNSFLLVGWLVLGLAASAIAVLRSRTTSLSKLIAVHQLAA